MPKKKVTKKSTVSTRKQASRKEILSSTDSYKSLFYGIATVIVLFILGFSAVKIFITRPKPEIDKEAVSVSKIEQAMREAKENVYTVEEGDSLWTIAEQKYNDGYKWTEIASANNLQEPFDVEKGQKLVIPVLVTPVPEPTVVLEISPSPNPDSLNVQAGTNNEEQTVESQGLENQPEEASMSNNQMQEQEKIIGNTYKITHGDDLWEIAVRAYGDGYRWVDIARANNLENPDLIHSDNVLTIPR